MVHFVYWNLFCFIFSRCQCLQTSWNCKQRNNILNSNFLRLCIILVAKISILHNYRIQKKQDCLEEKSTRFIFSHIKLMKFQINFLSLNVWFMISKFLEAPESGMIFIPGFILTSKYIKKISEITGRLRINAQMKRLDILYEGQFWCVGVL